MKRYMRLQTHRDDDKIPEGKAVIFMDDNGFVGTNNGEPFGFGMGGAPALYPETQGAAIVAAWNYMMQHEGWKEWEDSLVPMVEEVRQWWTGELTCHRDNYVFPAESELSDGETKEKSHEFKS